MTYLPPKNTIINIQSERSSKTKVNGGLKGKKAIKDEYFFRNVCTLMYHNLAGFMRLQGPVNQVLDLTNMHMSVCI